MTTSPARTPIPRGPHERDGRRAKPDDPYRFLKSPRAVTAQKVLVCCGDSITNGVGSGRYVVMLEGRLGARGYTCVNAGINGDVAWNLLQRLDEVIACRPDAVSILIGTNDSLAQLSEKRSRGYVKRKKLPEPPTLEIYRSSLDTIVARLQAETSARIAVLEIPPIGEHVDAPVNAPVLEVNAIIHEVAAAAGIPVLPLYERLVAALPTPNDAPVWDGKAVGIGVRALVHRLVLRRDWDRISDGVGLAVLTDHVHLNNRGATMIADLVEGFVRADA